MADAEPAARRPLASRSTGWANALAAMLLKTSITPNQISVISIVFAALAGLALWYAPRWPMLYLLAMAGIQLRLLCNLLDGMVAVEGGRQSPVGSLYNEFPDRIADSLIIVALGYAAGEPVIGWAGALAAALTAYIRATGGALGLKQDFRGPMAKPHRMAVATFGCLVALIEALFAGTTYAIRAAAWVILLGSILTCITRTAAIAAQLRAKE
jgi:phosphatidylglycerophosphate synthase